ncbi:MAG: hypothetical protein HC859_07505 [Bacteroidia bacterium]|nr:hypothetical protein [Bacteroidia bacterium]
MKEHPVVKPFELPTFWICTGFLIAAAGKLTLYGVTAYLIEIKETLYWPWTLHNTLSIVQNIFVGIGAWLRYKEVKLGDQVYPHNS